MALSNYKDTIPNIDRKKSCENSFEFSSIIQTGIRLARNSSLKCDGHYRIGSCIIQRRPTTFTVGRCSNRTHPLATACLHAKHATDRTRKITLHAEIDVLTKVDIDTEIDCMIIARTLKNGNFATSKPCDICLGAILKYDVASIVYFDQHYWHQVNLL